MSENEQRHREAIDRAMQRSEPIQMRYKNKNHAVRESIIYPKRWIDDIKFEASYDTPEGKPLPHIIKGVMAIRAVDSSPESPVSAPFRQPTLSQIEQSRPVVAPRKPTPVSQKPKQAITSFDRVQTDQDWQQLLRYYVQILIYEEQQSFLIPEDKASHPIGHLEKDEIASFLTGEAELYFPIRDDDGWILPIATLIMDKRNRDNLCFGYPILCIESPNRQRFFGPLMLTSVTCDEDVDNNTLTLTADDLEISYAVLSHFGLDYVDYEQLLGQIRGFDRETYIERTVELLLSVIENAWGTSIERVSKAINTRHETGRLYEVPFLFRTSYDIKSNLIQELTTLSETGVEDISPALKALLDHANADPYPPASLLEKQPSLFIERINPGQYKGVTASREHDLTVVTGPPGTGKSQMILNIVADAVMRGEKVLVASHTNAAVDVVVKRLQENTAVDFRGLIRTGKREIRQKAGSYIQDTLGRVDAGYNLSETAQLEDNKRKHSLAWTFLYELKNGLPKLMDGQKSAHELVEHYLANRAGLEGVHRALLDTMSVQLKASLKERKRVVESLDASAKHLARGPITSKIGLILEAWFHFKTPTRYLATRINSLAASLDSADWLPENPDPKTLLHTAHSLANLVLCIKQWDRLEEGMNELFQLARNLNEDSRRLSFLQLSPDLIDYLEEWVATVPAVMNPDTKPEALSALLGKLDTTKNFKREIFGAFEGLSVLGARVLRQHWLQQVQRAAQNVRERASDYGEALAKIAHGEDRESYPVFKRRVEAYFGDALKVFPVWATTNLSAKTNFPLEPRLFDLVIIDEASQCDIASAIPLLYRARRAVIIGDAKQLQHVTPVSDETDSAKAAEYGVDSPLQYVRTSLFRLASSRTAHLGHIMLKEHYRSHSQIISFSNKVFYERQLKLRADLLGQGVPQEFLDRAGGVFWLDVKGRTEDVPGGSVVNRAEINTIRPLMPRLFELLERYEWPNATIGIVTPFRPQRQEFQRLFDDGPFDSILVGTAHTFQGSECDILVFSTVVSDGIGQGTLGWLNTHPYLLNVAVTRARCSLLIVGDLAYCQQLPQGSPYRDLADYVTNLQKTAAIVSDVDDLLNQWLPSQVRDSDHNMTLA